MLDRFLASAVVVRFVGLMIIGTSGFVAETQAAFADTPIAAPTPVTEAEIAGWVHDLGSNSFRTRRTATRQLLKAGSQAVAPVAAAADTDELELASRCIAILKTLYLSENAAANSIAQDALKLLSKSERASVAQRAAGAQGQYITIRQTNINGRRVTDIEIDHKTIRITDARGKNIVVKVTDKVGGQVKTIVYKAKDLAELKKKHPEAVKLYEQYAARRINVGGGLF